MTVRIGLLAAARIAEGAVVAPARSIDGVEVVAVAARTSERAAEAARRWNVPRVHGSYRALLDDDDVDAVYIATPNALHRPWAVAALGAGKHVLVEKPIASNAADAERIAEAADGSGLVVMEASHWPYHPWASEVRALVDAGVLGTLETVSGAFEVAATRIPRDDIRWDLALGGGATMDLGVYPLGWVKFATDAVPTVVGAEAVCPVPGVDGSMAIDLAWPGGVRGRVTASMVEPEDHRVIRLEVVGSDGRLSSTTRSRRRPARRSRSRPPRANG